MLEAKNVLVYSGDKLILRELSLQLRPGEMLAVVGANGAGKSTLLRTLAGEIRPASGYVALNGRVLSAWKPKELACMRGVLSQSIQLAFPLPVLETVLLGRFPFYRQEPPERSREVALWALQQMQAQHLASRNINTLSGGEQQRVHLARVLTQIYQPGFDQPRFLLLDEPVSSLDIAQQHRLLELIRRLSRKLELGVLVILHDMNLAAQYADRILLMKDGAILKSGKPEAVFTPEWIARGFGVESIVRAHPLLNCPQITTYHLQNISIP